MTLDGLMTLEERLRHIAEMDGVLARLATDRTASAELHAAVAKLEVERGEWVRETDALLDRRARAAAALAAAAAEQTVHACSGCNGDRPMSVERFEMLLDRIRDSEELADDRLLRLARMCDVCVGCFDGMIESLDARVARLA
jgi:hypothetical protein